MRNSPFEIFRRNQRFLMVLLTGLSMFSFLFLDMASMRSGRTSPAMTVAILALICGGGLWVVGASRGKGSEYGLWGALLGAVIGFLAVRHYGTDDVVQTSIGSYSRADLQNMAQRRSSANRFVSLATMGRGQMFGPTDDQSLVARALLLHEAKQYGIHVSDDGVNDYIQQITDNHLSVPDFKKYLRDLGLPEAELFNILREELQARLAFEMDFPPRNRFGGTVQAPLEYWKEFSMLNVRESLAVADIPVAAFVPQIPEPKDEELVTFFEQFKNRLPTPDGQFGFLRNRMVKLAYLSADFETFEKLVPEPTPSEVEEYYAEHKERYRIQETPQFPGREPAETEGKHPASALEPANVPGKPSQPPVPDLPEPGCGELELNDDESQKAEPAQPDAAKTDQPKAEEPKPDASNAEPVKSENGASPKVPLTVPKTSSVPAAGDLPLPPGPNEKPEEVRYRELNDELRLEIRDSMLRERAFTKMNEAADRALQEMTKLADQFLSVFDKTSQAELAAKFVKDLQQYAEANHLTYHETKPLTQQELMASLEEPIGLASEPTSDRRTRGESVAREAFANDSVYYPKRANSIFGDKTYAWWKTSDEAPRVPAFSEVRTEVVDAWKIFQARPRAQKRAEELAEIIKKSDKPMSEALAGQTVTGAADAPAVTVKDTPRFSWLNVPRTTPFQMNQQFSMPTISVVDGVQQPGDEFMRVVFEQLKPGDTGVAPNQPHSDFYVVRVMQRDTEVKDGDDLALRALEQQFLTEGRTGAFNPEMAFMRPTYHLLAQGPQNEIESRWQENFKDRYKIVWHETRATQQQESEF